MELFEETKQPESDAGRMPLAARMRPTRLEDIVGQDHIIGPGKLLRRAIEADRLGSIILYGPPGCGKTSLAEVIARATKRRFERASGVLSNVEGLRSAVEMALYRRRQDNVETILFIDEIHRFNKAQQDVLLPHVENGTVTLIGATTHNPLFFIIGPLNSRSQVFELASLNEGAIMQLLTRALTDPRAFAPMTVAAEPGALEHIARVCEGDARRALNALEIAVMTSASRAGGAVTVTLKDAAESVQKKPVVYDRDEEGHYDTISAFIKSVRGSNADAALYWLAKMLYAGEDPRFIARRLVILAAEDIGNADPRGITLAVSASDAVQFVGMPEARIILAQATTYLATAPKSNASYMAVEKALDDVKNGRSLEVPEHLKNIRVARVAAGTHRDTATDYVYAHDRPGNFAEAQEYAPGGARYYEPTANGYEETIGQRMKRWDEARRARNHERTNEQAPPLGFDACPEGTCSGLSKARKAQQG